MGASDATLGSDRIGLAWQGLVGTSGGGNHVLGPVGDVSGPSTRAIMPHAFLLYLSPPAHGHYARLLSLYRVLLSFHLNSSFLVRAVLAVPRSRLHLRDKGIVFKLRWLKRTRRRTSLEHTTAVSSLRFSLSLSFPSLYHSILVCNTDPVPRAQQSSHSR